ncbi:hypothetical protein GCM10018782_57570 [Streptomyces griseoaurantiacus]|nr:hypothetical protein GCM10018782_57570 [Streptomyces griseoaurantiacus]
MTVLTAVKEAGHAGQDFFGRVVREQTLESDRQELGAVPLVLGKSLVHTASQNVLGPLPQWRSPPGAGLGRRCGGVPR